MRQIVLDTETTGIDPKQGHKLIEIGCVEMIDRNLTGNNYHVYINPQRDIDQEVIAVHGITNDFLADKPVFGAIADEFLDFIRHAELIIHNAPFDVGFINHEFSQLRRGFPPVDECCEILDTLTLARKKHPGQKNNLDALCKRYFIDNSSRIKHGALLDAEILSKVYLAMTGGQTTLSLSCNDDLDTGSNNGSAIRRLVDDRPELPVISATEVELKNHQLKLDQIQKHASHCLWLVE